MTKILLNYDKTPRRFMRMKLSKIKNSWTNWEDFIFDCWKRAEKQRNMEKKNDLPKLRK
jgi:hypothetical protein